jgi:glutaredoxin-like protein NrdH
MDKHNINYVAVDVTENPAALELIRSLGYATAPVFILGEEHWQGFQPGRLDPLRVETAA